MGRRSRRWEIDERGAPSPAETLRILRAWYASWRLPEIPDLDEPVQRDTPWLRLPATPAIPARRLRSTGETAARRAVAAELRVMVDAGMPPEALDRLTGERQDARTSRPRITAAVVDAATGRITARGIAAPVIAGWADEGVALISRVGPDVQARVAVIVEGAIEAGLSWRSIVADVQSAVAGGAAHAALIAQDQVAKLNSAITETMHRGAGITHYRWRSSRDQRVRLVHRQAEGQIIAWASPGYPGAGFYGEPAHAGRGGRCRCTAEPIPPDDW